MNPIELNSIVVREACLPFCAQLSTNSAFLICFIAPAFSAPVSNGMVSSTMWTEKAFQLAISGLSWVTAMVWGKVYRFLRGYILILLMISLFFFLTLMDP